MYKWHVHSAIGRGRPLAGDFARAADGIAASLRQFHVSASRSAEEGGRDGVSRPSRAQRSAVAAAEISSLAPGGIDARSLAAKPPPSFTIRRLDDSRSRAMRPAVRRGVARGSFSSRGAGQFRGSRGRGRGGLMRGQGRGGGGRGRGARRRRGGNRGPDADSMGSAANGEPYTPEQQAYIDSVEMGIPRTAPVGITTREDLEREVPAVATNTAPIGLVEIVTNHMRALAGQHGNELLSSEEHAERYFKGNGTLFLDAEDKARATSPDRYAGTPKRYDTLDDVDDVERQTILQTLTAGQYQPLKSASLGDTLTAIETYTQRNETYLPKDGASLKARVQKMLPKQNAKAPSRLAARR